MALSYSLRSISKANRRAVWLLLGDFWSSRLPNRGPTSALVQHLPVPARLPNCVTRWENITGGPCQVQQCHSLGKHDGSPPSIRFESRELKVQRAGARTRLQGAGACGVLCRNLARALVSSSRLLLALELNNQICELLNPLLFEEQLQSV